MFEWLTWEAVKGVVLWMINTGLNGSLYSFLMNNALVIALIVLVTPSKKDDAIWDKVKNAISNFKVKGKKVDD